MSRKKIFFFFENDFVFLAKSAGPHGHARITRTWYWTLDIWSNMSAVALSFFNSTWRNGGGSAYRAWPLKTIKHV